MSCLSKGIWNHSLVMPERRQMRVFVGTTKTSGVGIGEDMQWAWNFVYAVACLSGKLTDLSRFVQFPGRWLSAHLNKEGVGAKT